MRLKPYWVCCMLAPRHFKIWIDNRSREQAFENTAPAIQPKKREQARRRNKGFSEAFGLIGFLWMVAGA